MSDHKPDPVARETAVNEWEQQQYKSFLKSQSNSRLLGLVLAVITILALGMVWLIKSNPEKQSPDNRNKQDVDIAERKPVPKLNNEVQPAPPPVPKVDTPIQVTTGQDDQAKAAREEQARRMLEARLKSSLMANNPGSSNGGASTVGAATQPGSTSLFGTNSEKGAQDGNSKFARAVSGQAVPVSQAKQIANLEFKVLQGKLIEAVLEPRAISDLLGMVCAVVQRDVFSHESRNKLIPWGSRVCGVYSGDLRKGQERLFVVWNTLRRPDGIEVTLDSAGADQLGTVGLGGQVNTHFAQIFGTSALLSIIGAGASTTGVQSNDQNNSESDYRQSVQQAAAQAAQQILQANINIPPTVTVPAGAKVRIYVNRDLDFSSIYEEKSKATDQPQLVF